MNDHLVIGADAAGLSAALQVRRKQPGASVKVINHGRIISYGACGIPYVLSNDIASPEKLIHFTPESFRDQRGISVEVLKRAVGLDPSRKEVLVKDLKTNETSVERYGRLLIATGAEPRRLPFLDYGQEGIFNVHTIEDLERIRVFFRERKPRRAAVLGAGNIGLEVTEALAKTGVEPLLIEVLDQPASSWPPLVQNAVLAKIAEKKISFLPGTAVTSCQAEGGGFRLKAGRKDIEADVVFSLAGTKPATEFCGTYLAKLPNGAIIVDRFARTSIPDIFAAGDCASVPHRLIEQPAYVPLGSTANKMGRIAGLNMAGLSVEFPGVVGTQILKFFELSVAKSGLDLREARAAGYQAGSFSGAAGDRAGYYPGGSTVEVELVCDLADGRLLGAAVVCAGNAAQFIDPVAAAIHGKLTVRDVAWLDFAYAPPFAPVWNALAVAAFRALKD